MLLLQSAVACAKVRLLGLDCKLHVALGIDVLCALAVWTGTCNRRLMQNGTDEHCTGCVVLRTTQGGGLGKVQQVHG